VAVEVVPLAVEAELVRLPALVAEVTWAAAQAFARL
jgi:hypothetical protein